MWERTLTGQTRLGMLEKKTKDIAVYINSAWLAAIFVNGKRIHLGRFSDEVEAAKAYDKAALFYHGEFANPNFK